MGKVSEAHKISEISFESVKKINELIDELSYYKKVQEFKMDSKSDPEIEKNPDYIKYYAYAQIMNDEQMNNLIRNYINGKGGLADSLDEIVEGYLKMGLKKKIVNFSKNLLKEIKSEEFRVLTEGGKKGILGYAMKLRKKVSSRSGTALEKEYNQFIIDHAGLFLKKDKEGYTRLQKTVAKITAYYDATVVLCNIVNQLSKGVPYGPIYANRKQLVSALRKRADYGYLLRLHYREYQNSLRFC